MADPFDPPSVLHQLLDPIKTSARLLDFILNALRSDRRTRKNITVVCISDTHCLIPQAAIPYGDILIHAGDLTNKGTPAELRAQIDWLSSLPHKHKIAIAGNHDTYLDPKSRKTLSRSDQTGKIDWKDITYLLDSSTTLDFTNRISVGNGKVKIYGAPHIPACGGAEFAFQYPRGEDVWTGTVPADAEIVVTHTPPKTHLDLPSGAALGDAFLLREIRRVKPALHVFGHVHAERSDALGRLRGGHEVVRWDGGERRFEGIMSVPSSRWVVLRFVDLAGWLQLAVAAIFGLLDVFQDRILGHDVQSTRMVNASLMYGNTGRLGNQPQVIHL